MIPGLKLLSLALVGGALLSSCGDTEKPVATRDELAVPAESRVQLTGEIRTNATTYTIKILRPTVFKTSTASSASLPASQKCDLPSGQHWKLDAKPTPSGTHWYVDIGGAPAGCSFDKGYVYGEHVSFPELGGSYALPMPGAFVTSEWCVCRDSCSYCTSPHIGWDLSKDGSKTSVALANGTVTDVYLNGTCGWEVRFRDTGGALWLYRHLNQPSVSVGRVLTAGQYIGAHSQYPGSGCGSGPHLHLERLSAGGFRDAPVGASCRNGYSTCNYDPRKPFRAMMYGNALAANEAFFETLPHGADAGGTDQEHRQGAEPVAQTPAHPVARPTDCSPVQPVPTTVDALPGDSSGDSSGDSGSGALQASIGLKKTEGERALLDAQVHLAGEAENNACGDSGECIVKWELFMKGGDGRFARVLSDASVRNAPVSLAQETRYCAPKGSDGTYVVVARTRSGNFLKAEGSATPR